MTRMPDLTSPRELTALFKELELSPNIRYGQNFLIDANIVRKIVSALDLVSGEAIIEIGPGAGALTLALVKSEVKVLALEIDRGLVGLLEKQFKQLPDVTIMHQDALKVEWPDLIAGYFSAGEAVKLVSNLPYNISGPFMYALFKAGFPFKRAVLMFQKEVAKRLIAAPGDSNYGGLSVICAYYAAGEILFDVSCNVFWPRPSVDSAVICLRPRNRVLSKTEEQVFWKIVQGVFQQRRKTIVKSLSSTLTQPRDLVAGLLEQASIEPSSRPEDLDVGQFAMLARITYNTLSK